MRVKMKMLTGRNYPGREAALDYRPVILRFDIRPCHIYPTNHVKTELKTEDDRFFTEQNNSYKIMPGECKPSGGENSLERSFKSKLKIR